MTDPFVMLFAMAFAAPFLAGLLSAFVFARVNRVLGAVVFLLVAAGAWHALPDERYSRSANLMNRMGYQIVFDALLLGTGVGFAGGLIAFWRKKA